ncbi:MAG TPA: RNA-binding S4 domain-containing protein [Verrucomicrobiales bacterium]|nr:RNA-binding S4 domain-containing protein [Verrucomicrobiales bacterium]
MEGAPDSSKEGVRVDLWTWSVRLYKSRSLAAAACKKGHLLVNGQRCRAAKLVRAGDQVQVRQGILTKTLQVRATLKRRVSAKEAAPCFTDLTPAEEYARVAEIERDSREATPQRESGTGRPTKRDRRDLDEMQEGGGGADPTFEEFVKAFTKKR